MSDIQLSTLNLGTLYAIEVGDDLTHQVLLLSPAEVEQLRDLLNTVADPEMGDPARNREGVRLKALTIYNGHSLPTINRERYESENTLTGRFRFEVIQIVDGQRQKVGEL